MKNILYCVSAICLFLDIHASESAAGNDNIRYTHPVKCISHQGERFDAPIHSRPAYELAMRRKAELIKMDVHFTRDGVPVLSHDRNLKRTMNWEVNIKDKTLQEIRDHGIFLPVGDWRGEKIQTLREGLRIVRNCPEFWIDTKAFSKNALERILPEFDKAGISRKRIMLATFSDKALVYAREKFPDIRRIKHIYLKKGPAGEIVTNFYKNECKKKEDIVKFLLKEKERLSLFGMNLPRIAFQQGLLNPDDLKKLREAGLWCSIWFVNTAGDAEFFSRIGADAFVTDTINTVRPFCRTPKDQGKNTVPLEQFSSDFPQILYPQNASTAEKHAAEEVAQHLSRVFGKLLHCTDETQKVQGLFPIYVGRTGFAEAKKIRTAGFGPEEWIIRKYPDGILISGGKPRGTLYGAYEFLERFFGIIWLDELYTHIPKQARFSLPDQIELRGKPVFRYRGMYSWFGPDRLKSMLFRSRNRENIFLGINLEKEIREKIAHTVVLGSPATINTLYYYIRDWPQNGMEDSYSMNRNGKRVRPVDIYGPGQVCFSSEIARKRFSEQMIDFIGKDRANTPENYPLLYNLSVNDIKDICYCPECRARFGKYGSESGVMLEFVNAVATEVGKKFPDIRVQTSAYLNYEAAPVRGIAPARNVTVRLSPSHWGTKFDTMRSLLRPNNRKTLNELQNWSRLGSIQIWNYWILFGRNPDVNAGLINLDAIRDNLRVYWDLGADYVFSECEQPLTTTFHAMRVWIGYHLKYDPDRNLDELIQKFMAGYYGPAAKYMRAYYDYLVKRQEELPELETRGVLERPYLDAAFFQYTEKMMLQALAETGNSEYAAHVKNELVPLDIARLICCPDIPGITSADEIRKRLAVNWRFLITRCCKGKRKIQATQQMKQFLREYGRKWKTGAKYPIPPELKGKEICELSGQDFTPPSTGYLGARILDDSEAAGGKAMYFSNSDRYPVKSDFHTREFKCGIHDRQNKKSLLGITLKRNQIRQDEKYHFYRLGNVKLAPSSVLWIHWSWYLQQDLGFLYQKNDPKNNCWQIYVSLKFCGPAYVKGSKQENSFRMDRILLVR